MKKFVIALALVASQAFAGQVTLNESNRSSTLPDCKGSIKTIIDQSENAAYIQFSSVTQCSVLDNNTVKLNGNKANFAISKDTKIGGPNAITRRIRVPSQPGTNHLVFHIESGSGATKDYIVWDFELKRPTPPAPRPSTGNAGNTSGKITMGSSDARGLPNCGGTVETHVSPDRTQLRIKFSGVKNCKNYDMLSAQYERVDDKNIKLQVAADGSYYGDFGIPEKYIDLGSNMVRLRLQSNKSQDTNGKDGTKDIIEVHFRAVSTNPAPNPNTGNGDDNTTDDGSGL